MGIPLFLRDTRTYGMNAFEVCRLAEPTTKRWPRFGHKLIDEFPYLECEIVYACRNEMVCTVKDMLTLRFRIAYLNKDAALAVAPRVAEVMAKELKWGWRERKRQLKEAEDAIKSFGGAYPNQSLMEEKFKSAKDVRDLFNTFDHGKNGYIDFTEFKTMVEVLGFPFPNEKAAMKTFKKIDTKADGKITEDEFTKWWQSSRKDELRLRLDKFKPTPEKFGEGPGAAFG